MSAAVVRPAARASRLRRWGALLALGAAVGAGVALFSSTAAGYDERLLDLAARQGLASDVYRETADAPLLQALLLDVAASPELAFKMRLALGKYGGDARRVIEAFGADPDLHDLLRRFGEPVVPVIAYFMDNDVATLRASHELTRLGRAIRSQAGSILGAAAPDAATAMAAPSGYGPATRGRWAIAQIGVGGHQFLAQFAIDARGVAHWNQTDRVLKSVEELFAGGIRDLETRHDLGETIGVGDVAWAGADALAVFGFAKALKVLRAGRTPGKAAQWTGLAERRALMGRRVLLDSAGAMGRSALKLGATAGAVYLVLSHPGLLTGLFVEAGSWLGIPGWAAAAVGWWATALLASLLLLPLLASISMLNPIFTHIARVARWLLGWTRPPDRRDGPGRAPASATALAPDVVGRRHGPPAEAGSRMK